MSIQNLDLSKWDVSNAVNMSYMIYYCKSLSSINLVGWEFNSIQNLHYMLSRCLNLENLKITDWNFGSSNLSDSLGMFNNCNKLSTIDLSGWTLNSNVSLSGLFQDCYYLETVILDNMILNNCNLGGIFPSSSSSLKKISAKNWVIPTNFTHAFFRTMSGGASIEEIDVTGWDLKNTTSICGLFGANNSNGTGLIRIIGLNTWDTSNITIMSEMFKGLSSLQSFDLSSFNTSNVTNMSDMFNGCSSLTTLDLSSFNTTSVTNTGGMFYNASSLTTIYARTQADADKFNNSTNKPSGVTFTVKS